MSRSGSRNVPERNGSSAPSTAGDVPTPRAPKQRPASTGARTRRGGNHGNGKKFASGKNSHSDEPTRRSVDLIPRGTVSLLYQTIFDDDGTLAASLDREAQLRDAQRRA